MQVKIGPIEYEIVYVEDLRSDSDVKLYGKINHGACKISVKAGHNPQQQRQTIWHEITHAMFEQAGCNEDINNEPFTTALSHILMQVVQDNKWLSEEPK